MLESRETISDAILGPAVLAATLSLSERLAPLVSPTAAPGITQLDKVDTSSDVRRLAFLTDALLGRQTPVVEQERNSRLEVTSSAGDVFPGKQDFFQTLDEELAGLFAFDVGKPGSMAANLLTEPSALTSNGEGVRTSLASAIIGASEGTSSTGFPSMPDGSIAKGFGDDETLLTQSAVLASSDKTAGTQAQPPAPPAVGPPPSPIPRRPRTAGRPRAAMPRGSLQFHSWATYGEASVTGHTISLGVANRAETDTQPVGVHGASLPLPAAGQYTFNFNVNLSTWDAYNEYTGPGTGFWDSFSVSVTSAPYPELSWNDPVSVPWRFGGQLYSDSQPDTLTGAFTITVPGNLNGSNYLNVVLDTFSEPDADTGYPSWGTITINTAPVAQDFSVTTDENNSLGIDVLAYPSDPDDDVLSLSIASGPTNGSALINNNGTPGQPADDFVVYSPNTDFSGTDQLTYRVDDGYGGTATGLVTITVSPVNDARLVRPMDRSNREGDTVSLQLRTPDHIGASLTYTASGLPPGLTINSSTGLISGIVPYTAAQTNDGVYAVTVSAAQSGSSDSNTQSFTWYIQDSNRITGPDDQASRDGQSVSLPISAVDNTGASLIFSAIGLPPGLSINPNTGLISGVIGPGDGTTTTYAVTITVTGSGATDSTTFQWTVLRGPGPQVLIAINNTLATGDDITLVDPQTPIPAQITLYYPGVGTHQVQLTIGPVGYSTLSSSMFQLADGATANLTITPLQVSALANDVILVAQVDGQQAGQKGITNADIKFVGPIRRSNTPAAMPDRIPPRVPTPVQISVTPAVPGLVLVMDPVGNDQIGSAKFVGAGNRLVDTLPVAGQGAIAINVQGDRQTSPGNPPVGIYAGSLRIGIETEKPQKRLTTSSGFTVAAIPLSVGMVDPVVSVQGEDRRRNQPADPNYLIEWGRRFAVTFFSDSGLDGQDDLDEVTIRERITSVGPGTGVLAALASVTSGFLSATSPQADFHTVGLDYPRIINNVRIPFNVARARVGRDIKAGVDNLGNGTRVLQQFFEFSDNRTGVSQAQPVVAPSSGFQIDLVLEREAGGAQRYFFRVQKQSRNLTETQGGTMRAGISTQVSVEIV